MKLERFFEKFELFAEAPDAVARMREVVLELAVRGKLVAPADEDDPVENFLQRQGKTRNQFELIQTEKVFPFDLPPHWRWVALVEIVEFSIGKTPPRGDASYWHPEEHSWVSIADMKHYGTITETKEKVSSLAAQDVFRQRFAEPGSILMSFKLTIGKIARAKIRCFHNEAIISLQPLNSELADYLFRFLPIFASLQTSNSAIKGNTLNKGLLAAIPIALPPLAEQKRIVAKVDELMALCDQLEAQQQERQTRQAALVQASLARFTQDPTPTNLQFLFLPSYTVSPTDLRKTILTLAVQGKLVPQDPKDESADKWLLRLGLRNRISAINELGDEVDTLPTGWSRVQFEEIAIVSGGVTLGRKLGDRKTVSLPYLRVANVKRGEIDLSVIKEVLIPEDEIERYCLRDNDLLMTEGGDWDKVGRAAIWHAEIPVCLHQNHVFRARMRSAELIPFWFERYFNSPIGRNYFESASKQTTNLASINMRQVRGCPIPLPPLAEQGRIVAKVDELLALVDELETQLVASRTVAQNLLAALVRELTTTP